MSIQDNTNDLIEAAYKGNADKVAQLICVSDPLYDQSYALRAASANGWSACVTLLIPVSDPLAGNGDALKWAAYYGHDDCVALLLPFSNPKLGRSEALYCACSQQHHRCIDLLIDVSDSCSVLCHLQANHPNRPEVWMYLDEQLKVRQKQRLTREIQTAVDAPTTKTRKL